MLITGWGTRLPKRGGAPGRARRASGEAGAGARLSLAASPASSPRGSRPGFRLSLGTFLSELTINRWREAIFFGIQRFPFRGGGRLTCKWEMFGLSLRAGEDASVPPNSVLRDRGKLQPGPPRPTPRADAGSRDRASARQVPGVKVEKAER